MERTEVAAKTATTAAARTLSERCRSIRAYEHRRAVVLMLTDVAMLAVASSAAALLYSYVTDYLDYSHVFESALFWTAASVWTFKIMGLYRISYALDKRDEWYHVILGLGIGVAPLLVIFTLFPSISSSRIVLLISFVLSALLVGISRSLMDSADKTKNVQYKRKLALVASPAELRNLAHAMGDGDFDVRLIPVSGTDQAMTDIVSGRAPWYEQLLRDGCDEIVFAGMPTSPAGMVVEYAARDRIAVGFTPSGLTPHLHGAEVLANHGTPRLIGKRLPACTTINVLSKRLLDIAIASIGLLLTFPAILLGMLAILIESGRPVIFRQVRVGRGGKPFEILKLRTMRLDAETRCGPVWAVGDPTKDDRTTKVGGFLRKMSIDELPQFVNVLRGEMSVVGPRPERPIFVDRFREQYARYDERHLVRPGITGWSHVHMRRSPGMEEIGERLELDLFYLENYSLLLDVFIIFKTGVEVLFHRWA